MKDVLTIIDPNTKKKRNVGYIEKDNFYKIVERKKHYLRVVSGYAIQSEIVDMLKFLKIKNIYIIEKLGKQYSITLDSFLNFSRPWTHGHGKQIAISEKYLTEVLCEQQV